MVRLKLIGSIKTLTTAAATLPALLMFFLLIPSTVIERTQDAESALRAEGEWIAEHIAYTAEYALITGNKDYLANILRRVAQRPPVVSIQVFNVKNQLFYSTQERSDAAPETSITFIENVYPAQLDNAFDIAPGLSFESEAKQERASLGYVSIVVSKKSLIQNQRQMIIADGILGLLALVASIWIGQKIGNRLVLPIFGLVSAVRRMRKGDYSTAVDVNVENELAHLSRDIEEMRRKLLETTAEREKYLVELAHSRDRAEELVAQRTKELVEARDEALNANRAKDMFLATVSHELRTPIQAVIGFVGLLRREVSSEQGESDLEQIRLAGYDLLERVNELLDYKKIESGHVAIHLSPVDVDQLICEVLGHLRPLTEAKGNTVSAPAEPIGVIYSDRYCLRKILLNLISNANKFTKDGLIHVDAERRRSNGENLFVLSVRDTGIGISDEDQKRIFEPFVQADGRSGAGGTGLGLAIVKQLSEMLGGGLSCESMLGHGSAFTVSLPFHEVSVIAQSDGKPERKMVLVAEDTAVAREVIVRILDDAGHGVTAINNGADALAELMRRDYDVAILDLNLPKLSGLEAAKQFKQHHPDTKTKIAILTADTTRATAQAVQRAGFICAFKPIDERELCDLVNGPNLTEKISGDEVVDLRFLEDMRKAVNKPEFLEKMVAKVQEEGGKAIQVLEEAAAAGDVNAFRASAHCFESALISLGGVKLANFLAEIQSYGDKQLLERANVLLETIQMYYFETLDEWQRYIRSHQERA